MAETTMDLNELLDKVEHTDDADFLREGVRILAQHLMEAEVGEHAGAGRGERAPDRRAAQRS